MDAKNSPRAIDAHQFRRVMGRFATGVTVVTATALGETRGMTASVVACTLWVVAWELITVVVVFQT